MNPIFDAHFVRAPYATIFLLALLPACSASSGASPPPPDPDGGAPQSSSGCTPSSPGAAGSCSVFMGGDSDAGSGGSLSFCTDYTGSEWTLGTNQQACPMIDGNGTYGLASASPCPTANQVGGSCVTHCGDAIENVTHWYTASGDTAAQVKSGCTGTYLP
jgi:hypothetical protein